jgi:hypothetical protein
MAYAIARMTKLKGGSIGASGSHNDRTRETPNTDPERAEENRLLIGDGGPVHELVSKMIDGHGGKPRSDSVECVEILLTASPEFFLNDQDEIDKKKVEKFVTRAAEFLKEEKRVGKCVKAVLHMDERTPHVQAHCVPIDPKGKLNCKYFFGSREKLSAFQDAFHEKVKDLGLERGMKGSRARHTDIKKFYGAITREYQLTIDRDRLLDPPRMSLTKEGIRKYKDEIIKAVNDQVKAPLQTLQHQAMQARGERAMRKEVESRMAERIAAVERSTSERVSAARSRAGEAILQEQRSTRLYQQQAHLNKQLEAEKASLLKVNENLQLELADERGRTKAVDEVAQSLSARLKDIPLRDVLERLGYEGEHGQKASVYRGEECKVALILYNGQAYDGDRQLICRNSLELVMQMVNANGNGSMTKDEAVTWLANQFGEQSALAACLVEREQAVEDLFEERRQSREAQEKDNVRTSIHEPDWEKEEPVRSIEHTHERDNFIHE